MDQDAPAYRYYAALEGSYLGELSFRVTSFTELHKANLALLARMRVTAIALIPGPLASQTMATTLAFSGPLASKGQALHTTTVTKWRAQVATTRETIFIEPDGRSLRMVGTQAMWPALGHHEPYEATGEIDASGTRASYTVPWLGSATTIHQRTEIVPGGLHLTQDTPWSHAQVTLLRR